jgi:hypothetical protein
MLFTVPRLITFGASGDDLTQLRHLVQPECGFAQVKTPKAVSRSLKG